MYDVMNWLAQICRCNFWINLKTTLHYMTKLGLIMYNELRNFSGLVLWPEEWLVTNSRPLLFLITLSIMMMMRMMMRMMMMMMMNCFCGMVDRRKVFSLIFSWDHCQILTIANLRHAASRVWTCAESEFRLSWMKLCNSDNHYTAAPTAQKTCSRKKFYQIDDHQHFKMELLGALQSLQGNLLSR